MSIFKKFKKLVNKQYSGEKIIRQHVALAVGAGFIPVPVVDVSAVSVIQLGVLQKLSDLYEVEYSDIDGKMIITALAGGMFARLAASAVKTIPVFGSLVGGFSMSVLAGASTYAIGQVYMKHLENGGSVSDFDAGSFRHYYEEMFERGTQVAVEYKQERQARRKRGESENAQRPGPAPSAGEAVIRDEVIEKLRKLGELRDKGIITDGEFAAMKEKMLN